MKDTCFGRRVNWVFLITELFLPFRSEIDPPVCVCFNVSLAQANMHVCAHSDACEGDIIENAVFVMHLIKVAIFSAAPHFFKRIKYV